MLKLDTNGHFVSDLDMGGAGNDYAYSIAWDPYTGNAYTVGSYSETASIGSFTLTTAGGLDSNNQPQRDLFMAELTM